MEAAEADRSVMRKGLFQFIEDDVESEQTSKIVAARPLVIDALRDNNITIQSFDESQWCYGLSIAENLAFGKLTGSKTTPGEALYSDRIHEVLDANGFDHIVEQIGQQIAKMIVQGLSSEYTRDQSMIAFNLYSDDHAEEIMQNALAISKKTSEKFTDSDRNFLMLLFLNLVLDNHDDIRLPGSVVSRIMFIRDEIDSRFNQSQRSGFKRFEFSEYSPGLSVLENLVFGLLPRDIDDETLEKVLAL